MRRKPLRSATVALRPRSLHQAAQRAYEALHPETRNGRNQHTGGSADFANPSFAEDQAVKTGMAERTVRLDAERGSKIADDALAAVKGTPLDTGKYFDALKVLPKEEQAQTD